MKKIFLTALVAVLWGGVAYGQQLPGDSLAGDFKLLVKYLEQTHPDPYTAFGGRVHFHKRAREIGLELENGATRQEFADTALAFMSTLGDGHTRISSGGGGGGSTSVLRLPLLTQAAPDGMRVIGLPQTHSELMGSRVVSIDGVTIEQLALRVGKMLPVENEFGAYKVMPSAIHMHRIITQLIPGAGSSVAVELETAPGSTTTITMDYLSPEDYAALPRTSQPRNEAFEGGEYMSYRFLDRGRRAMYFRFGQIVSREAFDSMRATGISGWERLLTMTYNNILKRPMPEDPDEAIAALPSLHRMFAQMLAEMKDAGAPYLVIDLRDNDGGYTPMVYQTLYQIWGEKYHTTPLGAQFYTMVSPLYMQKFSTTLDEFNAARGSDYDFGDFIFSADANPRVDTSAGGAIYTPERVFVLTNTGTFSAAFHYAFYLWKMGATVVGVPSSQAPNTFMEVTSFTLPYTGLEGSISNAAQLFLPADDPRAKVFWPDIMLTGEDYRHYGFDRHSELLYLMDYLELEK